MQTPASRTERLAAASVTPRKLKAAGSNSGSASSPKTVDRRLPRSPATEKKRPNKGGESEPRISQLQEELRKTKEQLSSSEIWKRRAQQEAEEAKKQLKEISESEEERVQELRKISQDRDRAWQSELEAFQKQYSMDSAALASAMNEIQKLKMQLDRVSQSEASQARHAESAHAEIQSLRVELTETLVLVERLKKQLNESREYEARAIEELEAARNAEKELKLEHESVLESHNSLLLELEQSNNSLKSLEELVASLRSDLANCSKISSHPSVENEECDESSEINILRSEVDQQREAELETKLKESMAEVEDLKASLLSMKQENETLKCEMAKTETERNKASDAENEALMQLDSLTEKADKSCKKVARVTEQLDAAEACNSEMEAELRRLKVQCDQWRKAAEAAAAMLSNGKYGERRGSLDYHSISKKLSSPVDEDTDDESPKKKNGNMLKKIGVLLKKGQK